MVCPAKDLTALPGDADPQQLAMISINPPGAYLLLDQFVQLQSGDYIAIKCCQFVGRAMDRRFRKAEAGPRGRFGPTPGRSRSRA